MYAAGEGVCKLKAAVMRGIRKIEIENRPMPIPGKGEVLVKIRATGICGSDVHGFVGPDQTRRQPGLIPGHEAAGEVAEVGESVDQWRPGDKVVINPQIACGTCYSCMRGWRNLCDNIRVIGSTMRSLNHGAMCEYIVHPSQQLHRLPENVTFQEGAMLDPVGNAFHVFNRACLKPGESVAVIGCGSIGLVAVQVARLAGAGKIICADISDERLELARQFGVDATINADTEDSAQFILSETSGRGADIVVEAVGLSKTYSQSVMSARKRGTVLALGFMEQQVAIPIQPLLFREISVIGCTGFAAECETALRFLEEKRIILQPLITHEFPLDEVQKAFEATETREENVIKCMLLP
jgi:L-iditol 2-dehydrogenase